MDLLPALRIADSTAILMGLIVNVLLIADRDDRTAVGLGLPRGTRLTPQAKRRGRLGWLLILAAMVANFLRQLSSEGTTIELILAGAVLVLAVGGIAVAWLALRQLRRASASMLLVGLSAPSYLSLPRPGRLLLRL